MKFDQFDAKMRVFETAQDLCVPPEMYMVARIDGRGFTRLTKEQHPFDVPYDAKFRDLMVATTEHLMQCGFKVVYAYTQSDEISLLFVRDEELFGRKLRKYNSVLAGEASAKFSVMLGDLACFDCRISQLPNRDRVVDYFRWRNEDAARNCLNGYCYWTLRKDGQDAKQATSRLSGMPVAAKHELLFGFGINFNGLPNWQKRGVGLYWEEYEKESRNPITGDRVTALRRRIKRDLDLPMKQAYGRFVESLLERHA